MAKVTITIEPDDSLSDPEDDTGLTEAGFNEVMDALSGLAISIEIRRGGS